MTKQVLVAGAWGAGVFVVWTIVVNGLLGFRSQLDMKQLPNERAVYEVLEAEVTEPGRYTVNPVPVDGRGFPPNDPVFGVMYSGVGHGAAGRFMLLDLLALTAPFLGAWLLLQMDRRVLSRYWNKVLVFGMFGLMIAVAADLREIGIGGRPLPDGMMLLGHDVILWTLIGAVVAWRVKPKPESQQAIARED